MRVDFAVLPIFSVLFFLFWGGGVSLGCVTMWVCGVVVPGSREERPGDTSGLECVKFKERKRERLLKVAKS